MIFSRAAIRTALAKGILRIEPLSDEAIGPAHIDLRLGGDAKLTVPAKSFTLAKTLETITLTDALCGFMEGRASLAKQGISIEQSSTFIEPGSNNQMTLEIFNASDTPCVLEPGQPIAKMFLMKVVDQI